MPEQELYATTGIQQLPFNTLYQLVSALGTPSLEAARTMLLIPDLLAYWLTGSVGAEATNASTTQLYDVRGRAWAKDLAKRVGLPDENAHAPNEKLDLGNFHGGIIASALLYQEIAGVSKEPTPSV